MGKICLFNKTMTIKFKNKESLFYCQIILYFQSAMDAVSQSLQSYKQKVWEKINLVFQGKCQIVQKKDNEISLIPFCGQIWVKNRVKITIKSNPTSLVMQAAPLQKISGQFTHEQHHYISVAQKINKQLTKDDIVFWVEQDQNFTVRKITPYQCLKQSYLNIEQFFQSSLQNFQEILQLCKTETLETHLQARNRASIQNRINLLQHLKFQYQVNRRQRQKTTTIDFNNCKIKCIAELITLKEACSKEHKNYMVALRQHQLKSAVNGKQALSTYGKIVQAYKKRQEQHKVQEALLEKQKILNPIKIRSCKQINEQLEGTFSHIQVVQSQFSIIFSLNLKTTEFISKLPEQNVNIKDQNCLLVKKKKCEGCQGESQVRKKINQSVFQNEKQMLILLNPYFHSSICSFYVEQYAQRKEIKQIYSKKLPADPISRFLEGFQVSNPIKSLKNTLRFLTEVAEGIQFLSSHEALHRDLKPTNVLLDQKNGAKIIDFGSSCPTFHSALESNLTKQFDTKLRSTKGYYQKHNELPSEVSKKYSKEEYDRHMSFDVYSLGSVAQFLMPGSLVVKQKYSLEVKGYIEYLIKKCKDIHPDDRMTALEAVLFLKQLTNLCQKMTEYK